MDPIQENGGSEPDGATDGDEFTTARRVEQDGEEVEPHIWLSVN